MTERAFASASFVAASAEAVLAPEVARRLCRGHFPDAPLVPGAYALGLLGELACALFARRGELRRVAAVPRCTFHHPLHPDARLVFTVREAGACGDAAVVDAEVRTGARLGVRATLHLA